MFYSLIWNVKIVQYMPCSICHLAIQYQTGNSTHVNVGKGGMNLEASVEKQTEKGEMQM